MARVTPRHTSRELPVGDRTSVRIAVVADTHSSPHPRTRALLALEEPDWILHAGDIGRLSVLDELAEVAPTVAIRGNIDERTLPDSIALTFERGGAPWLTLLLTHIAVRGPRLRRDAIALAKRSRASLVVCGHSHVPLIATQDGLSVFNPGSIGPRRFHLPITFGVLELGAAGLRAKHVDCETGQTWLPPGP